MEEQIKFRKMCIYLTSVNNLEGQFEKLDGPKPSREPQIGDPLIQRSLILCYRHSQTLTYKLKIPQYSTRTFMFFHIS